MPRHDGPVQARFRIFTHTRPGLTEIFGALTPGLRPVLGEPEARQTVRLRRNLGRFQHWEGRGPGGLFHHGFGVFRMFDSFGGGPYNEETLAR